MKPGAIAGGGPVDYMRVYDDILKQLVEEYKICHQESCLTSFILVQDVRNKLGLTQSALASLLSIPIATLQSWEQDPCLMGPAAQILLMLLDRDPESAQRALRALQLDPGGPSYPMPYHATWPPLSC